MGLQELIELLRCHIEVTNRNFFHSVLVFPPLHKVHGAISSLSNQIHNFEAANKFVAFSLLKLLKITHLVKVLLDLLQVLKWHFFVELLKKRDVGFKFLIKIANVNEGPVNLRRKNYLECLPILFNTVKEPQASQAVQLELVLYFSVLS